MKLTFARPILRSQPGPRERTSPRGGASFTRRVLRCVCARLTPVPFQVSYWDGSSDRFGEGEPAFHLRVRDPAAVGRIRRAPDPALGEAYMAGAVDVDDLDRLLDALSSTALPLPGWLRLPEWTPRATPLSRQYQEIQAHYDRGNDFFALWLDASRTYSCAYFRSEADDLETAQAAKIEHVLRKAQLRPGDTLLDIGSGWGALLLAAARRDGVRAHGITLSRRQHDFTEEAIRAADLQERASVALLDYLELAARGASFDRVVSVGMLEHVGRRNLPVFLGAVKRLLKPGGIGVLHSITRAVEGETSPWLRRHIFPGGYVPSWREVTALLPEFGFHLTDAESLRRHYALTLSHWARRFEGRLPEVQALGFDEPFIRMWRLYLRGCEAKFRAGSIDLHQFVFTHGINSALPLTRDYLYADVAAQRTSPGAGSGHWPLPPGDGQQIARGPISDTEPEETSLDARRL